jgi:hypothetical protein
VAAGPAATVARLVTVVEGLSDGWERSEQRLSTFEDDSLIMRALDRKIWIGVVGSRNAGLVNGSTMDHRVTISLELARYFGTGTKFGKDYYTLNSAMAEDSFEVLDSLLNPNNWDYSNTGLFLIEQDGEWEETEANIDDKLLVWSIELTAHIRQATAATVVA